MAESALGLIGGGGHGYHGRTNRALPRSCSWWFRSAVNSPLRTCDAVRPYVIASAAKRSRAHRIDPERSDAIPALQAARPPSGRTSPAGD